MIGEVLDYAADRWPGWFPDESAPDLDPLLLAGGPAHRDRVSVLLFPAGARVPRVILKIGFTAAESAFLNGEFEALSELRPRLPSHLKSSMPRVLGVIRPGDATAVAAQVLEGQRLLIPGLTGNVSRAGRRIMDSFFARSFAWSRQLAEATRSGASTPREEGHLGDGSGGLAGGVFGEGGFASSTGSTRGRVASRGSMSPTHRL